MPARRFFIEGTFHDGETVAIAGNDAHKIVRVLRLGSGDTIEVIDSTARRFDAELTVRDGAVEALLANGRDDNTAPRVAIDVAQGVPKGSKMDFVVEKLSELGVRAIRPFESERCVARGTGSSKVERWRRLAHAAAQQSGRIDIPAVDAVVDYAALLGTFSAYDVVLFPWEVAEHRALRETLPDLVNAASRILVVVGPEGGFSHDEAALAKSARATIVSLGEQILRTETAALFVVSVLRYLMN